MTDKTQRNIAIPVVALLLLFAGTGIDRIVGMVFDTAEVATTAGTSIDELARRVTALEALETAKAASPRWTRLDQESYTRRMEDVIEALRQGQAALQREFEVYRSREEERWEQVRRDLGVLLKRRDGGG